MNFNFLMEYQDLSTLLNYCNECESFAHSAPDISITAARKALESVVKLQFGEHSLVEVYGFQLEDQVKGPVAYCGIKLAVDFVVLVPACAPVFT